VNDENKTMSPRRLAQVIRREAWIVALVTVLAIVAALVVTAIQTPMYRAKMTYVVGKAGGQFEPEIGDPTLTQTITTLLQSEEVASQVIDGLGLKTTPEKLSKKLKVLVRPNSAVLEVDIDADSTEGAERILREYSRVFNEEAQRLGIESDNPTISGTPSKESIIFATLYTRPRADPEAVSPRRGAAVVTATLLGLILGLVLAFVRERLDDRIRTRQEAEDAFGVPVIGGLPAGAGGVPVVGAGGRRGGSRRRDAALEEALQMLSLNLELIDDGRGAAILVTSTQHEEGKSTVVANLAVTLARDGSHVVCVEADPQQPGLRSFLNVEAPRRNGSNPASEKTLDELLRPVDVDPGLSAAPAGDLRVMSFDDWQTGLAAHGPKDRGATLVKMLRASADYVIIDAAPIAMGDASRLALLTDTVLVVARAGRTTNSRAATARAILRRLGVRNVSVVLTEAGDDDLG
jgi:receptor protein-tyrosine kinase